MLNSIISFIPSVAIFLLSLALVNQYYKIRILEEILKKELAKLREKKEIN